MKKNNPYIFISPDGSHNIGLCLIVEKDTGVFYGNQCAGYACSELYAEGYLVPLGKESIEKDLMRFFEKETRGWTPDFWKEDQVKELETIVSKVPCWETYYDNDDKRHFLKLDRTRIKECVEAWVPVLSPLGKGILLFGNSD